MAILVRCVAAVSALFLLAACSSSGGEQGTAVTTVVSSVTLTSAKPAAAKSSSSAAPQPAAPATVSEGSGEGKEFVECIYGGGNWTGTAWFADGSYGTYPECEELRREVLRENPYRCPRTDHQVPDPSFCQSQNRPSRSSTPAPAPSQPAAPVASYEPVPTETATPAPAPEPEPDPAPSATTGPLPATDAGY